VKISKYQELCKVCDQILMHDATTPQITANDYLHVLRGHPEILRKYYLSNIEKFWVPIRAKLVFVVRLIQSIFNRKYKYSHQEDIKSDVLFVSHFTNEMQLLKNGDTYFGDLPDQLTQQGVSSSVFLMNYTKLTSQKIVDNWKNNKVGRFVLKPSLGFLLEIKLFFSQRKSRKLLKHILKGMKVEKETVRDILCHHSSSTSITPIRIAMQVADVVKKTNAKFIVTTYEGHAWERLVYYYVRKINPNIKCFGYQHAAVFEYQHAIKRLLNVEYNPDVVLTSGLIARNILKQSQLGENEIVCVGSPKHLASNMVTNKSQSCLVVPEAFVSECLMLFRLSLEYAKQHKGQKFVWRLHPLVSLEELKKQSIIFKNLPNNVCFSEDSLDEDIKKCDSVLYRGSTAVVNAINAGLKPIYYQQSGDELSIDPIYTHEAGKFIVCNQEEFGLALSQGIDAKTMQSLQDFAQDFYTPLDVGVLLKEIEG